MSDARVDTLAVQVDLLQRTVMRLDLEVKDAVRPRLQEHETRLDEHGKQLSALRLMPEEIASIHHRLNRHERSHEDTDRALRDVVMGLAAATAERQVMRAEQRTELQVVKDLILRRDVPRAVLLPSAVEEGLRAKLAERDEAIATLERENAALRATLVGP